MRRRWPWIVLLIAAGAPYLQVATHEFVNWDDPWLISENRILARFAPATVGQIFFDLSFETRTILGSEYLPMRDLLTMVEKRLFGGWAGGFLLVNAALYCIAVLLLYELIRRLHGARPLALVAALLYAVHPIHVESVAWASSNKDMLCLVWFLSSILLFELHLTSGRRRTLLAALICFLAALMSKYIAIGLPAWIVLRLWWRPRPSLRSNVLSAAPFVMLGATYLTLILAVGSQTGVLKERSAAGFWPELVTVVGVWRRYLFNLVLPFRLSPDYRVDVVGDLMPGGLLALVFLCLATGVIPLGVTYFVAWIIIPEKPLE